MLAAQRVVVVPSGGDLPRQRGAALLRGGAPPGFGVRRGDRRPCVARRRASISAGHARSASRPPRGPHARRRRPPSKTRAWWPSSTPRGASSPAARRCCCAAKPARARRCSHARCTTPARMPRGAFVAINCASLPETLIESELFGYRAGAFTGAQRAGRRGKILQADGGTLFLDEIADMPIASAGAPAARAGRAPRLAAGHRRKPCGGLSAGQRQPPPSADAGARGALPRRPVLPAGRHRGAVAGTARSQRQAQTDPLRAGRPKAAPMRR